MESKINEQEVRTDETFDGGVAEEQIKVWNGKHGKVVRIDIVDDGDLHVGYFHRPRLETMSAVAKQAKADELKSSEVMLGNCWLGRSLVMRTDVILFLEATKQLGTMLNSCRQNNLKHHNKKAVYAQRNRCTYPQNYYLQKGIYRIANCYALQN